MQNEFEFDDMRQQLQVLKNKLDKQEIVNGRLMRSSMKSKMSWIRKYLIIAIFAIPFVMFCLLPMTMAGTVSWWWYGFTFLMITADVVADWYINYIPNDAFLKGNLVETAQRLVHMKKLRKRSLIIGFAVLVFWIGWMFFELYGSASSAPSGSDTQGMSIAFMVGAGIGGVIGYILGLCLYFKMQRTNDDILRQIEEITQE